jgi:hypothetical protein
MGAQSLSLLAQPRPVDAPRGDLGRMLDAREVAAIVYEGKVGKRWVLDHVAPLKRLKWGRTCYWYEADARAWKQEQERRQLRAREQDEAV